MTCVSQHNAPTQVKFSCIGDIAQRMRDKKGRDIAMSSCRPPFPIRRKNVSKKENLFLDPKIRLEISAATPPSFLFAIAK